MRNKPTKLLELSTLKSSETTSPQSSDRGEVDRDLELLARWMDSVFEIPGLRLRFGLDSLLGLLPGAGDFASSLASIYILSSAQRYGVPRVTLTRMTLNILIDLFFGAIPLVGDAFDLYWKSNQRNVELLRRHVAASPAVERKLQIADRLFVGALIGLILLLTIGSIVLGYFVLVWLSSLLRRAVE